MQSRSPSGDSDPVVEVKTEPDCQRRLWYFIPWCITIALVGIFMTLSSASAEALAPYVFLSGIVLLGIPHGAADWWLGRSACPKGWFPVRFLFLYSLSVIAVLAAWPLAPGFGLAAFVVLTMWHWGSAEAFLLPSKKNLFFIFHSFVRGGWVMLAPFAAHPEITFHYLDRWEMSFGSAIQSELWVALFLACLVSDFILGWVRSHNGFARRAYLFEVVALGSVAWLLTPLWWVSLYFLVFHSWRHLIRVRGSGETASLVSLATLRFAPLVLLSVAIGLIILVLRGDAAQLDPLAWSGSFVVLLAALTVPHAIVVRLWERQQATIK